MIKYFMKFLRAGLMNMHTFIIYAYNIDIYISICKLFETLQIHRSIVNMLIVSPF